MSAYDTRVGSAELPVMGVTAMNAASGAYAAAGRGTPKAGGGLEFVITSSALTLPLGSGSPPTTEAAVKASVRLVMDRCSVVLGTRSSSAWGPLVPGDHVSVGPLAFKRM